MPNSIRIVIDTSDLERLPVDIQTALAQFQKSRVIGQVLAKGLLDSTDRAFETETDPNTGEPWAEWSPAYANRLRMLNKHHKKLQDKGMGGGGLRSTIQTTAEESRASIGSNLRYARIHQLGGGDVKPGFPARPYLGLDETTQGKVAKKIGRLLMAALQKG